MLQSGTARKTVASGGVFQHPPLLSRTARELAVVNGSGSWAQVLQLTAHTHTPVMNSAIIPPPLVIRGSRPLFSSVSHISSPTLATLGSRAWRALVRITHRFCLYLAVPWQVVLLYLPASMEGGLGSRHWTDVERPNGIDTAANRSPVLLRLICSR